MHPFSVSPSIGTEKSDFFAGKLCFAGAEHWFKFVFLKNFIAHSRTAKRDCIKLIHFISGEIGSFKSSYFCACCLCTFCNSICHRFCVSRGTPINYCYFTHLTLPYPFFFMLPRSTEGSSVRLQTNVCRFPSISSIYGKGSGSAVHPRILSRCRNTYNFYPSVR